VVSVWDDGYGISVPVEYQTTKGSISEALAGFEKTDGNGIEIIKVKGWDYPALIKAYQKAARIARDEHTPVLVHVVEVTQPQGHSASGSHERYKSKERLAWETEYDCNLIFRDWILKNNIANDVELKAIEKKADNVAKDARKMAWDACKEAISADNTLVSALLIEAVESSKADAEVVELKKQFDSNTNPQKKDGLKTLKLLSRIVSG
jgi:TPP-dependent pyruvate/acetoin dehydrogenase alpha subunit